MSAMNRIANIIGFIAMLLTPVLASASNGFLSENSRPEKFLGQREIHRVLATVNAETHRVCDDSCREHAADRVVAPKTAIPSTGQFSKNDDNTQVVIKWTNYNDDISIYKPDAINISVPDAIRLEPGAIKIVQNIGKDNKTDK
jgi:hypothetical protein